MHYDLIVVGGGPGGYVSAIRAAQLGKRVALIEEEQVGGTCLNHGCIPTKTLYRTAEVLKLTQEAARFGVNASCGGIDLELVRQRERQVVDKLASGVAQLLKSNGVALLSGQAAFADPKRIVINGESLTADRILLATGSKPAVLPVPGIGLPGVMDSGQALRLDQLPSSLVIIGGGVVGVEMAGIYRAFGAEVAIVEFLPSILANLDGELIKFAAKRLAAQGIKLYTAARVTGIQGTPGAMTVTAEGKDGCVTLPCTHVLSCAGRVPRTDGLELDKAGVALERGAVKVDGDYRTNVPGIYAIGDVIGGVMLAHVASDEGRVCVERICGMDSRVDYELIPSCVFAFPEMASVGKTEEQLKARCVRYQLSRFLFAGNGKALSLGETEGFIKILASEDCRTILGVHIAGPHASDLIHEAVMAMKASLTVEEAADVMHAHPSLAEAFMECMQRFTGQAIHVPPKRRL